MRHKVDVTRLDSTNPTITVTLTREQFDARNRDLDRHFSIEKEEVGHCRDCKHWDMDDIAEDTRFCMGIGVTILTEADFGCVKFQAK